MMSSSLDAQRGILTETQKRTKFCGLRRRRSTSRGDLRLGIVYNIYTGLRRNARRQMMMTTAWKLIIPRAA